MEKMNPVKLPHILSLRQSEQINRLWSLFNNKILDTFVEESEILIKGGSDLGKLSKIYQLPMNLHQQYVSMKRVLKQTEAILELAKSPNQGWKVIDMDDKCTLSVRTNNTMLEMKSRGILPTNVKNFLYLAYLIKLYPSCLPFCKQAHDIKQISRLQKVGFIRLSIPIPLIKDRCTFLRGIGFDRIDKNGTICIFAQGINENKEFMQKNGIVGDKLMKGKQLLDLKHFAISLKCINNEETQYSGYCLVDHHIPFLPERLVAFVAREMAKYLFNYLMKQLKNFEESIWAKEAKQNYDENGEFYDWITQKVKRWVQDVESKK